jgi:hypothetical protein
MLYTRIVPLNCDLSFFVPTDSPISMMVTFDTVYILFDSDSGLLMIHPYKNNKFLGSIALPGTDVTFVLQGMDPVDVLDTAHEIIEDWVESLSERTVISFERLTPSCHLIVDVIYTLFPPRTEAHYELSYN